MTETWFLVVCTGLLRTNRSGRSLFFGTVTFPFIFVGTKEQAAGRLIAVGLSAVGTLARIETSGAAQG